MEFLFAVFSGSLQKNSAIPQRRGKANEISETVKLS
jgi:hypothetical protein